MKTLRFLLCSFSTFVCSSSLAWGFPASGDLEKGQVVIGASSPPSLLVYDSDGVFLESIGVPQPYPTRVYQPIASIFDARTRRLFVTTVAGNFGQYGDLLGFEGSDPHAVSLLADMWDVGVDRASGFAQDAAGNLYLAHGGFADGCEDPTPSDPCPNRTVIRKLTRHFELDATYLVKGGAGIGRLDVTLDGSLLYYTCEGLLERFDTVLGQQLPSVVLPETVYGLQLLPPFDGSGGLLVSSLALARVRRLDASGNPVQVYDLSGTACRGLELDPGQTSFWATTNPTPNLEQFLWRVNVTTGAIELGPISLGNSGAGHITAIGAPSRHKILPR